MFDLMHLMPEHFHWSNYMMLRSIILVLYCCIQTINTIQKNYSLESELLALNRSPHVAVAPAVRGALQ